jgi:hypothetical protein
MNVAAVPDELKARPQWVTWQVGAREGKLTKIPINPRTGGPAKTNDRSTWGTFDEAVSAWQRNGAAGIGFVFSVDDPFTGVDLDHALVDGQLRLCAKGVLDHLGSYGEISPSGQGVHAFVKGKLPPGGRRITFPCGLGVEMYETRRFFTVTSHHLPETPPTVEDRQAELEALHRQLFDSSNKQKAQGPRPGPSSTLDLDDAELIDRAHKAANGFKFSQLWAGNWQGAGYASHSEADLALCEMLAFWTGGDPVRIDRLFWQSGLYRNKWDRTDYRERTIARALSMTTEFYNPGGCGHKPEDGQERPQGGDGQAQEPGSQTCGQDGIPIWPEGAIDGVAGDFARTFARFLETPLQFLAMAFLTILGHIIGSRINLLSELKTTLRLFVILLGKSGDTRKSTVINTVINFFIETVDPNDLNIIYGVGSAEGLAKCFGKSNKLILAIDELKTLVQKMKIDSSVLLPCINTLFETCRFNSHTKAHDIILEDVLLSVLAASTVETYQSMFNSTFTDIGFINRLFIVIGGNERKFAIPQVIPETEKQKIRTKLVDILRLVGELSKNGPYFMPMTSDAREIFEIWYFERPDSVLTTRLDTYGHRLMPLLAINEGLDIITGDIAAKTIALLNYQYHARQYANPIDADNCIAKLEERIRRLLASGPLTKRDLERRGNKARHGIWLWDQAIKNLRSAGEITWDPKTKKFTMVN